jgi:hypothetical protein
MWKKDTINQHVEKILNSQGFCRSGIYVKLFKYLVNSSLKGEVPKESIIEMDVFDSKPGDRNIRAYIHTLRKKLDDYYKKEGNHDSMRFTIPKGAYKVEIVRKRKRISKKAVFIAAIVGGVIINMGIWLVFFHYQRNETSIEDNVIWEHFLEKEKKTFIIIGNYFFFRGELPTGNFGNMRDFSINSLNQFNRYLQDHPAFVNKILPIETTYLGRDGLYSLPYIIDPFIVNHKPFDIKISDMIQWDMVRSNNIIYIGAFKNLRILKNITEKLGVKYLLNDNALHYHNPENDSTYQYFYEFSEKKNLDYTFVSFIQDPNGNAFLFIISNHDIGCISASKFFSNTHRINVFKEKYFPDNDYFKALFVAKGMVRTGMTIELIHANALDKNDINKLWE